MSDNSHDNDYEDDEKVRENNASKLLNYLETEVGSMFRRNIWAIKPTPTEVSNSINSNSGMSKIDKDINIDNQMENGGVKIFQECQNKCTNYESMVFDFPRRPSDW